MIGAQAVERGGLGFAARLVDLRAQFRRGSAAGLRVDLRASTERHRRE
jgi:hypothetical protein